MSLDLHALGARIAKIRSYWNMSQTELAEFTLFPLEVIVQIENGELEPPLMFLIYLSAAFRLNISDIIGDTFSFQPYGTFPESPVKLSRRRI